MVRHPAIALLAAALLANPRPSQAQFMDPTPLEVLNQCVKNRILQRGDSRVPAPITAAIADGGGRIALRACNDNYSESHIHYFLRTPSRHQNGVCEVAETEVFPGWRQDILRMKTAGETSSAGAIVSLRNVTRTPPSAWTALGYAPKTRTAALATDGDCPAMADTHYIDTTNVPDETLKQIQAFWRQATTSPAAFDQALGDVPYEPGVDIPMLRRRQTAVLNLFREKALAGDVALDAIACTQNTCKASFGDYSRWIDFSAGPEGMHAVQWGVYIVA